MQGRELEARRQQLRLRIARLRGRIDARVSGPAVPILGLLGLRGERATPWGWGLAATAAAGWLLFGRRSGRLRLAELGRQIDRLLGAAGGAEEDEA